MTSQPFIPYGRQIIEDDDVAAVVDVLNSNWLTTGPAVGQFEEEFAKYVGSEYAVAVSSGTAALHLAMLAAGVSEGDEVIVSALTFVASANAARYVGATVVFADIDPNTFLMAPDAVAALVTPRTKAIVTVDYAGLPSELGPLRAIADAHNLTIIEDASHAPGATYQGRPVGSIADFTAFSFHPVKHITTGEGGMVTTQSEAASHALRALRSHGIASDFRSREAMGTWEYDQVELGFNYRLADTNCALGLTQLRKQPDWLAKRRGLAARYKELLASIPDVQPQLVPADRESAWHLFPIRITGENVVERRRAVFETMRADGIGVNVHYRPVYLHTYYQNLGYPSGLCPVSEEVYDGLLSLPMWPGLDAPAQDRVVASLTSALAGQ